MKSAGAVIDWKANLSALHWTRLPIPISHQYCEAAFSVNINALYTVNWKWSAVHGEAANNFLQACHSKSVISWSSQVRTISSRQQVMGLLYRFVLEFKGQWVERRRSQLSWHCRCHPDLCGGGVLNLTIKKLSLIFWTLVMNFGTKFSRICSIAGQLWSWRENFFYFFLWFQLQTLLSIVPGVFW